MVTDDFMKLRLVSDPQIAPDGSRIACVVTCIDRDKNKYLSEIWIAPNGETEGGEARPFTSGDSSARHPRWSPDGTQLAFLSDRRDDGDIAPAQDDIYTLAFASVLTEANGDPAKAVASSKAVDSKASGPNTSDSNTLDSNVPTDSALTRVPSPPSSKDALTWSPDGSSFAYVGNPDSLDTWGTRNERVYVLPAQGGEVARDLTGDTDRSVGYLTLADSHEVGAGDMTQWTQDSKRLYFPMSHYGETSLHYVDVNESKVEAATFPGGEVGGFSVARDGITLAYTEGSATRPHELYAGTLKPPFVTVPMFKRTTINNDFLAEVTVIEPESVGFISPSKTVVRGWLLKPRDAKPGEKYPLVVYVHGGPHLQYGNTFFHELQWLAAEGYVVLYTNPRGSKGYGEAHTGAIKGSWGSVDYEDILAATGLGLRSGFC